jgi:hypothetical protein
VSNHIILFVFNESLDFVIKMFEVRGSLKCCYRIRELQIGTTFSTGQIKFALGVDYDILTLNDIKFHIGYHVAEGADGGFATICTLYIK